MKTQLTKVLTTTAEHHVALGKAHATAAEAYEDDSAAAIFHKAASAAHADQASTCVEACKVLAASMKSSDDHLDKLIPNAISIVTPDRTGLRPIYRHGQRENPEQPAEIFSKIYGSGTDEE
jgi:hypothetical protein